MGHAARSRTTARRTPTRRARPVAATRGTAAAKRRTPRAPWLYPLGLLTAVVLIGAMALTPLASLTAATERVEALKGERAALGEAVDALQVEADRLENPLELEGPAREDLGLSRPGEVPYIVVNPPTEPPAPVGAAPDIAEVGDGASTWQRVGEWFSDLLP